MTGPEHYREAERLIGRAHESQSYSGPVCGAEELIAEAQVHATLALVAVSVHTGSYEVSRAWAEVIS